MNEEKNLRRNLAETLIAHVPTASVVIEMDAKTATDVVHIAVPKTQELKEIDLERLLPAPRRTQISLSLDDSASFIAYVNRHASDASVVWCKFDPVHFGLAFLLVVDEIGRLNAPAWRKHQALYNPATSHEWNVWTMHDEKPKQQLEFAEFLERNENDIVAAEGRPSSLQMMQMATQFEANSDKRIKSVVRLQGGGARLDYVDDDNDATVAQMRLFDKFAVGLPVFRGEPGYLIDARLKYRHAAGKVSFWYELIRPDRVHEKAALELIERVRAGIGNVPIFMGKC